MVEPMQDKARKFIKLNFAVILIYGIFTTLYEAWQLITPSALMIRWVMFGLLLIFTTLVWLYVKQGRNSRVAPAMIALIASNTTFISANIYFERGMASRAVMLYILPILGAGLLNTKSAAYMSALFCSSAYVISAVAYSLIHPSEGYKIEIYGTIIFYCTFMFVIAGLVNLLSKSGKA